VLLLIPPEYAYNELKTVSDAFKSKDAIVLTASAEKKLVDGYRYGKGDKTYAGSHLPDYALKDITNAFIDSIDAVILLPGETSTFTLRALAGADVKKVIEKSIQKKKVIGAIGSGVFVLGSHGFLEHAEVSSIQSRPVSVAQLKVKAWKDDPKVVVDLPFITAGEFSHSKALVEEIIKAILDHK
ncbi:MAG TPA: DJ-1/PfpI family protein, partial [Gemmata sp.]|nr:DJ-1/PfpI family protein [Gemmata sp.]